MRRKRDKRGFTLIELIIVIAIIAILAAIAIPSIASYTADAQEAVCDANRAEINRLYRANYLLHPEVPIKDFILQNWGALDHCPAGGEYFPVAYISDVNQDYVRISCSKHGGSADRIFAQASILRDRLDGSTLTDQEKRELLGITNNDFGNTNQRLKLLRELGGSWETLDSSILDATEYVKKTTDAVYVQPFLTSDHEVVLYANTNRDDKGGSKWATNLVFNHEDGRWYEYIVKHPYNDSRVSYNMAQIGEKTDKSWADLRAELKDPSKWRPVN